MPTVRKTKTNSPRKSAGEKGAGIHDELVSILKALARKNCRSCLDDSFLRLYSRFLECFERYQKAVRDFRGMNVTCGPGCSYCCCHWVDDVNSFEAEIIVDCLHAGYPPARVKTVLDICRRDVREMGRLECKKLKQADSKNGCLNDNDFEELLLEFYRLKRPCPLLDENGRCMVYPFRPLTCRVYLSCSPPEHCAPGYGPDDFIPTCIIDIDDTANEQLDLLHFMYDKGDNNTGLRSLLLKYLS